MSSSMAALFLRRMSSFRGIKMNNNTAKSSGISPRLHYSMVYVIDKGMLKCFFTFYFTLSKHVFTIDNDVDELELQVARYKPEGLDTLCKSTKFTRKELQVMYRGFKQECPTGVVNEETFKEIYSQFFPQGDATAYAHYVFNAFDHDHNGSLSFEEFVTGLSVLSRGTFQERLQWAFSLYDVNGDGVITREEMLDIVRSIYEMMGRYTEPSIDETTAKEHVDRVFLRMDANHDGVISIEEFMDTCQMDENISNGMSIFDTVL